MSVDDRLLEEADVELIYASTYPTYLKDRGGEL